MFLISCFLTFCNKLQHCFAVMLQRCTWLFFGRGWECDKISIFGWNDPLNTLEQHFITVSSVGLFLSGALYKCSCFPRTLQDSYLLAALLLRPQVALQPKTNPSHLKSSLFSSALFGLHWKHRGGTLTGVPVLVSSQLADFCIIFISLCVVSYAERCGLFIYSAGCRWSSRYPSSL